MFSLYIAPVGHLLSTHQQYADDTQLHVELASSDPQNAIQKLENCVFKLHLWFCLNGLALNPGKSEVVVFGTHQRLRSFPVPSSVNIAGVNAAISPCITTLGVSLDKHLTMDNHVMTVRRGCLFHLRALRHLRPVLPRDIATTIAVALIQTRLDYACSSELDIEPKHKQITAYSEFSGQSCHLRLLSPRSATLKRTALAAYRQTH